LLARSSKRTVRSLVPLILTPPSWACIAFAIKHFLPEIAKLQSSATPRPIHQVSISYHLNPVQDQNRIFNLRRTNSQLHIYLFPIPPRKQTKAATQPSPKPQKWTNSPPTTKPPLAIVPSSPAPASSAPPSLSTTSGPRASSTATRTTPGQARRTPSPNPNPNPSLSLSLSLSLNSKTVPVAASKTTTHRGEAAGITPTMMTIMLPLPHSPDAPRA